MKKIIIALCCAAIGQYALSSPTGYVVSSGAGDGVLQIDLSTGSILSSYAAPAFPLEVAVGSGSPTVYVASQSSPESITYIDPSGTAPTETRPLGHAGPPVELEILPNGQKLYTVDWSGGGISVVDTQLRSTLKHIPTAYLSYDVAMAPDSSRVYATALQSSDLFVIDTATDNVIDHIAMGQDWNGQIAVTPDGSKAYVTQFRNQIAVVNLMSGVMENAIPFDASFADGNNHELAIAIDPLGNSAIALGHDTINIVDLASDTITATIPIGIGLSDVAFDPAGSYAYVLATERTFGGSSHIYKIDTDGFVISDHFVIDGTLESLAVIPEPASIGLIGLISGGIYFIRRFFVV